MCKNFKFAALIFMLFAMSVSTATAAETTGIVDWTNPDTIDPYDPDIGDFLDVDIDILEVAAWNYYQDGDYETAAKYYLAMLRYDTGDSNNIYNLACCYGLLGESALAAQYLQRAFMAGFNNMDWINSDADFDSVRGTAEFDTMLADLEKIIAERKEFEADYAYFEAPSMAEVRIEFPENYDPNRIYPLVVGLHGLGSNPDQFVGLYDRFNNPQFIFACVRAPYLYTVTDFAGWTWALWDTDELWNQSRALTERHILSVVDSLKLEYKIGHVYLLGFSQGAGFTMTTGISNYEHFDGLICFGGWLDTEYLTEDRLAAASGLPVLIGHGTMDIQVDFAEALDAFEILGDHGYDVTFFSFEGGHEVPVDACLAAQMWIEQLEGVFQMADAGLNRQL